MKASFLWAAAVTFEWHEQERGLATRMTIEGRKHASLADVKDIFFFFGQKKIEGFLLALEFCPFQQKIVKKWRGENWPKIWRERKSNEVQKWKKGE